MSMNMCVCVPVEMLVEYCMDVGVARPGGGWQMRRSEYFAPPSLRITNHGGGRGGWGLQEGPGGSRTVLLSWSPSS